MSQEVSGLFICVATRKFEQLESVILTVTKGRTLPIELERGMQLLWQTDRNEIILSIYYFVLYWKPAKTASRFEEIKDKWKIYFLEGF